MVIFEIKGNIFVVKSSSFDENYVLVKLNLIYVEKCVKLL